MKTTIDLPDALFQQSKITAAKRGTTLKNLVIQGLETVLKSDTSTHVAEDALSRLQRGYHLRNKPLTRDKIHVR